MRRNNQNEKLNDIFETCLERLFRGESIERCLGDYPDFASELKPLLDTAIALRRATNIKPREEFRARARYEFQRAIAPAEHPKPRPSLLPRWATALLVVLAVILTSSTTVAASAGSMPDSPLYPVKLAAEQARLMLPASQESKATTYADFMDRRVAEIVYMAEKGDRQKVAALIKRLDTRLIMLAAMTQAVSAPASSEVEKLAPALEAEPRAAAVPTPEPAPAPKAGITEKAPQTDTFKASGRLKSATAPASKLKEKLATYAARHPAALKAALDKAPESVRPEIMRAISIAVSGYERALKTLD